MVVRAIDQQPLPQRFDDEGSALDREIDADDQSLAADFADEIKARRELFESRAELRAALEDVCEQNFLLHDGEKLERRRADERAAAEGRAVHSGA